ASAEARRESDSRRRRERARMVLQGGEQVGAAALFVCERLRASGLRVGAPACTWVAHGTDEVGAPPRCRGAREATRDGKPGGGARVQPGRRRDRWGGCWARVSGGTGGHA